MPVNWLEVAAAVLGVINIVLLVRRSIWNYAVALVMVTLVARVCYEQHLYSDALLQIFFFALNLYGWWNWARHGAMDHAIDVERLGWPARLSWLVATTCAALGWGAMMARLTDAAFPYWDGAIAIFSIAAQILLARRLIENWIVWIAVDIVAIGVYFAKSLYAFAGLSAVLLLFCIIGLLEWQRAQARQYAPMVPA